MLEHVRAPMRAKRSPIVNDDPVLRPTEAAEYLRVSRRTIDRLTASGKLKTVQVTDVIKGVRRSELERYMTGAA